MCRQLTINRVQVSNSKNSHGASSGTILEFPQPALEAEEHCSTEKSHQENQQQEPYARRRKGSEVEHSGKLRAPATSRKGAKTQQDWIQTIWEAKFLKQSPTTTHTFSLTLESSLSLQGVSLAR